MVAGLLAAAVPPYGSAADPVMRLLHLAPASRERAIERGGLRGARATLRAESGGPIELPRAVFAMPVLPDWWTSHQWLREMRRWHDERMIGVHFRVPDREPVHAGRYGQPHRLLPASEAVRWVIDNPAGAQLVVPRSVPQKEVLRIRPLSQLVGWTETPDGPRTSCFCPVCLPPGSRGLWRRLRAEIAAGLDAARRAPSEDEAAAALGRLELPLERAAGRFPPDRLLAFTRSPHPRVRRSATRLLALFRRAQAEAEVAGMLADADPGVREAAVESLVALAGAERAAGLVAAAGDDAIEHFIGYLYLGSHGEGAVAALEAFAGHPSREVREAVVEAAREALEEGEDGAALRERLAALAG